MSSNSTQQVRLSSDLFRKALDKYIDCNKPDPLSRNQLEGWSLQWHGSEEDQKDMDGDILTDPSHLLQGRLEIGGDFMVITLHTTCMWKATLNGEKASTQYGDFYFSCHATARFWTSSEMKNRGKNNQEEKEAIQLSDKKDQKIQEKIQAKMMTRLRNDAYISKLLVGSSIDVNSQQSPSKKGLQRMLLAQAKIRFSPTDLEERVTVSDDICEAIKRAVWSSAESPLDVVEVLLHLPFLPTTDHIPSKENSIYSTSLANRARLRLLEDAMCDACEKEGEEELLDDLKISDGDKTTAAEVKQEAKDNSSGKMVSSKLKKGKTSSRKRSKAS